MAHGKMSGQIFISYRREDSAASAGRLYDRLSGRFPSNRIFIDVDNIAPGVDFVKAIEKSVGSCDVLISVVGERWLTATDEDGKRRLDCPDDFVRLEIATALRRDIRVIPVLVDGASMPRSGELPDELKSLVRLQALKVSQDRFRSDSAALVTAVDQALKEAGAERRKRSLASPDKRIWLGVAGVVTVLALFVAATILYLGSQRQEAKSTTPGPAIQPIAALTPSPPVIATPSTEEKKPEGPTGNWGRNLLTNGSFESGTFAGVSEWISLAPGSTAIDGWTTFNAELAWGTTPNSANIIASDGVRFLDLTGYHDRSPYGGVTQTVATTMGNRYRLSFDLGTQEEDPRYRGPVSALATAGVITIPFTFNPSGAGNQWHTFSFDFTALSVTTPISILGTRSVGGDYIGLDRVSVTELEP
jgi:hypothetical protein